MNIENIFQLNLILFKFKTSTYCIVPTNLYIMND